MRNDLSIKCSRGRKEFDVDDIHGKEGDRRPEDGGGGGGEGGREREDEFHNIHSRINFRRHALHATLELCRLLLQIMNTWDY